MGCVAQMGPLTLGLSNERLRQVVGSVALIGLAQAGALQDLETRQIIKRIVFVMNLVLPTICLGFEWF